MQPPDESLAPRRSAGATKTILIVDDRPVNRQFLVSLLTHVGYRLLEACDGVEALALAKAEAPNLIIADLLMPQMDGFEFVRALRQEQGIADIPVIYYSSAYSATEAESLGKQCGVSRVLAKPSHPKVILQAVADTFGSPTPGATPPAQESFQQQHLRLLTNKLSQKVDQLEATNLRLTGLLSLGPELIEVRDRQRLLEKFCRIAEGLLETRYVSVALKDRVGVSLHLHDSAEGQHQPLHSSLVAAGQLPLDHLLQYGHPIRMAELADGTSRLGLPSSGQGKWPVLVVPLTSGPRLLGGLFFIRTDDQVEFNDEDERVGCALAASLTMSIENGDQFRQIQENAARQEVAREEERARIAREIHDELGQALTGLKMDLSWLSFPPSAVRNPSTFSKTNARGRFRATIWAKQDTSELRPSPGRRIPADENPWQGGPPAITLACGKSVSSRMDWHTTCSPRLAL